MTGHPDYLARNFALPAAPRHHGDRAVQGGRPAGERLRRRDGMTFDEDRHEREIVSRDETPIPHEANDMAPGVIPELDARASFDKLMRFAASEADGSGASYAQGVMMAFQELGWHIDLWSDRD